MLSDAVLSALLDLLDPSVCFAPALNIVYSLTALHPAWRAKV